MCKCTCRGKAEDWYVPSHKWSKVQPRVRIAGVVWHPSVPTTSPCFGLEVKPRVIPVFIPQRVNVPLHYFLQLKGDCAICRVGQNRIYGPCMTYDRIFSDFPAKKYRTHTVYIWFWPTLAIYTHVLPVLRCLVLTVYLSQWHCSVDLVQPTIYWISSYTVHGQCICITTICLSNILHTLPLL